MHVNLLTVCENEMLDRDFGSSLNHVDSGTGNPSETQGRRALSPTHRVTAARSADDGEERGSTSRGGTAPSGSANGTDSIWD